MPSLTFPLCFHLCDHSQTVSCPIGAILAASCFPPTSKRTCFSQIFQKSQGWPYCHRWAHKSWTHLWTNSRNIERIVGWVARAHPYVSSWAKSPESFKFELRVGKGRFVNWNQDFVLGGGSDSWQAMQSKKEYLRMELIQKGGSDHSRSLNKSPEKP